jgi:hypothetical protein
LWIVTKVNLSRDIGNLGFDRAIKDDEPVVRIGDVVSEIIPSKSVLITPTLSDKTKVEGITRCKDLRDQTRFVDHVDPLIQWSSIED